METKLIRETAANNADIGYNFWPGWSSSSSTCHFYRVNVVRDDCVGQAVR